MYDMNEKITGSIRLTRGDHKFIKEIGNDSFSKGFDLVMEFYKENREIDLESEGPIPTKHLLEILRNKIGYLEQEFGEKELFREKIASYKKELESLEYFYENFECGEADKVINILKGRFGS